MFLTAVALAAAASGVVVVVIVIVTEMARIQAITFTVQTSSIYTIT